MILNVNDFNCAADGRFLEQVSIKAGSAVLTDPDGLLRPNDVGKHIAIPGARDLVTSIARLIEHREVKGAQISAGSNILSGILIDPAVKPIPAEEPFLKSVHVGRRITVAGAGPNGETLITDVIDVISPTKIKLASAASMSITNAKVILNRGDRVALGDYARRSVQNVKVGLGSRSISDGEMTVGGRALLSKTARFSSEDLNRAVIIKDAGLLVTTIQSFNSNTQVTLTVPAQLEVAGGQADIWKTDSRKGWEQLIASLDNLEVKSAEIVFGPGVYDFTRIEEENGPIKAAIGLLRKKNLTIRGAGLGVTILRLMPQQDLGITTHFIETVDCKNITFRDFSVHGAYLTLNKTNEQIHGITLNEGSEDILLERVRIFQSAGDGIRFLGRKANPETNKPENKVRRVQIQGCQLIQNKRTGLAFQRAVEFVSVQNCYIEMIPPSTDSCIDLEPSGLAPTDLIFDSNFFRHATEPPAVSISGSDGPDPARRIKFSNNEVLGGNIFCTDVQELAIQNNYVRVTNLGAGQHIPIHVALGGESVLITGNLLVNEDPLTKSVISLGGKRELRRSIVSNNICFAGSGVGIRCLSNDDLTVQGNMIVATNACNHGIFVHAQSSAADHISVRDNDITVQGVGKWENGIQIFADQHPVMNISITGNSIRGAERGIVFQDLNPEQASQFMQTPLCALNRIGSDVLVPFKGIEVLPNASIIVGGASDQAGFGRLLTGSGSPEGKISGNIGDLFLRLDGKPGETLYVKESGNNSPIGWTAK